jgi:hypothetical protein
MATQPLTVVRPSEAIIATFGDVTETNDRIAQIEVRPGMREGQMHGLGLRCWGHGHWCIANGHVSHFTSRQGAEAAALRWIKEGCGQ